MSEPIAISGSGSRSEPAINKIPEITGTSSESLTGSTPSEGTKTPTYSNPNSPRLSSSSSVSESSSYQEDWEILPLDKLTVFDILDNFFIPQQLEKLSRTVSAQKEKVRKQRDALKSKGNATKQRVVEEWRRRVPPADEQLDKYRKSMRASVDKLGEQWNDTKAVTAREKLSFICGVLNIFISGYLIGGFPEYFHWWYTAQLLYFMPVRYYTYQKRGYHYFLADLCYFVNLLCLCSIWLFPQSKRLFISSFCLAFGNNAIAIAMWRNSMVFHSLDKVTSLFIHIMPCVTLHCLIHCQDVVVQQERFPAIWAIKNSPVGSKIHYNIFGMAAWSSIPYAIWQLSYHFLITVRRREKIAAGRPTSFTWLRKSYSKAWLGKMVLSLPHSLQEPAFMLIQYSYALLTMLPCPIWFWYRYASAAFLLAVFCWSVYNGATFYIDVFGKRFQNELEAMKQEVQKWQSSPDLAHSPSSTPKVYGGNGSEGKEKGLGSDASVDKIPLLSEQVTTTTMDEGGKDYRKRE